MWFILSFLKTSVNPIELLRHHLLKPVLSKEVVSSILLPRLQPAYHV